MAAVVLVLGGCGSGSAQPDRDAYERLRPETESVGTEASGAAYDAVSLPAAPASVGAVSCSSLPLGPVRLRTGGSLAFDPARDPGAGAVVAAAWEQQGLADVTVDEDDGVRGTVVVDDVEVEPYLSDSIAAQDGSGQQLRSLNLTSRCFDVGEDLARDVG